MSGSALLYRTLVDNALDLIGVLDASGTIRYASASHEPILGYRPASLIGRSLFEFAHEDDVAPLQEALREAAAEEWTTGTAEFRCLHRDGSWRVLECVARNALADPDIRGIVANSRDVTERKRAEQRLAAQYTVTRVLAESASLEEAAPKLMRALCEQLDWQLGEFWRVDPEATVLRLAGAWYAPAISAEAFVELSRSTAFAPGERVPGIVWASRQSIWMTDTFTGPETAWAALAHRAGLRCAAAWPVMDDEKVCAVLLLARTDPQAPDEATMQTFVAVTEQAAQFIERRRVEAALRASEARFRTLATRVPVGTFQTDADGDCVFVNEHWCAITGLTIDQALGRGWTAALHPEDRERVVGRWYSHAGADELLNLEFRCLTPQGVTVWVDGHAAPLRDADGVITGYLGTLVDITERKTAEVEHARLSAIVEQAGEAIILTNPSGVIMYANPVCERLTGFTRAELCGQHGVALLSDPHDVAGLRRLQAALERGEIWVGTQQQRRKDGTTCEVEFAVFPVRDAEGALINFAGIGRDVTREHEVEGQLRQAQKLEAVGRLAGAVAHDFNNQLTVIKGSLQLLLGKLSSSDPRRRDAERIHDTVERSTELVRQLLTVGRRQPAEMRPLEVRHLLQETGPLLRLLLGEQIVLQVVADRRAGTLRGDRGQIEQVLMNLVANARDAIGARAAQDAANGRGVVRIEAHVVDAGDPEIAAIGAATHTPAWVRIAVSDNGIGMPPEVQERMFEPLFTTKAVGAGTGLGLATVFGIVLQHEGRITCSSTPGRGTTFRVYFPSHQGTPVSTNGAVAVPLMPGGTDAQRLIVVAEDEERVREVVVEFLEEMGYRVLAAAGADEALAAVAALRDPVDLLITDVVMPGANGQMLARSLARTHPGLRILYMSGYLPDTLDLSAVPGARFLAKPFDLGDLLQQVRELLAD